MSRRIAVAGVANACYFRSGPEPGHRKALLQITERCDLRCSHCFVSATKAGRDMNLDDIAGALARTEEARVSHLTLTGGEPFVHPDLTGIIEFISGRHLPVTICTNAVSVTAEQIEFLSHQPDVTVNVSLDGFTADSHGRFRGDRDSFHQTVANAKLLGEAGLLKGILSTPNALAATAEYTELYEFARSIGAEYLLMNPLSSFGRGVKTRRRLRADDMAMRTIQTDIARTCDSSGPEPVFIRFPNVSEPLSGCVAGDIIYVFVNGDTAVCPYLVFAAREPGSQHSPDEFIPANLFNHDDFAARLDGYDFKGRYQLGANATCAGCAISGSCGKGCPAAVISAGGRIGDLDADVCPISSP